MFIFNVKTDHSFTFAKFAVKHEKRILWYGKVGEVNVRKTKSVGFFRDEKFFFFFADIVQCRSELLTFVGAQMDVAVVAGRFFAAHA